MITLMPKPMREAFAVFNVARHSSGQSRNMERTTLDGAGTRNDGTHPWRTANSVATVTTTNGTMGGSTLRTKLGAFMLVSHRCVPEPRTRFASVARTVDRYAALRYAARVGRACGRG